MRILKVHGYLVSMHYAYTMSTWQLTSVSVQWAASRVNVICVFVIIRYAVCPAFLYFIQFFSFPIYSYLKLILIDDHVSNLQYSCGLQKFSKGKDVFGSNVKELAWCLFSFVKCLAARREDLLRCRRIWDWKGGWCNYLVYSWPSNIIIISIIQQLWAIKSLFVIWWRRFPILLYQVMGH